MSLTEKPLDAQPRFEDLRPTVSNLEFFGKEAGDSKDHTIFY